jgi:hypothetical protein
MSNHLAVATVTAALRRTLLETTTSDVPGADVTTLRPNQPGSGGMPPRGINVFLYQVQPNASLRNADTPTRRADGAIVSRPTAAIDLHYLLSFFGDETTLEPQRLLASAVRSLHTRPILARDLVDAAVADPALLFLAGSDLSGQGELVRFQPMPLSLEDLSKLWSVFFQVPYALSVAYRASVVLIDADLQPTVPLPVRDFTVRALPLARPAIDRVVSLAGDREPILAEAPIALVGRDLRGDVTSVEVSGVATAPPTVLSGGRIELTLPAGLRVGLQSARVMHDVELGAPPLPHRGVSSNLAPFVLHPAIAQSGGSFDVQVTNVSGTGTDPRSARIDVGVIPVVAQTQRALLEIVETGSAAVRTFAAEPRTGDTGHLRFAVDGVPLGDHLVRVRIDGAESPFQNDSNPLSPTFGQPIAPRITIP